MRRVVIISVLSLVFMTNVVVLGHACTCPPERTPSEELAVVDEVFLGVVVAVVNLPYEGLTRINITVTAKWKGAAVGTVTIYTPIVYYPGDGGCGVFMEENEEYLVYATYSELGMSASGCSRTRHILNAGEDLSELGDPQPVPVTDSTWGSMKALFVVQNPLRSN
jgi:hypothetical protein